MLKPLLVFLLMTSSSMSFAASDWACFAPKSGVNPAVQFYAWLGVSTAEKVKGLSATCAELNPDGPQSKIFAAPSWSSSTYYAIEKIPLNIGLGVASFSNMQSDDAQKKFKALLEKFKMVRNRHERIRLTYELVMQSTSNYDFKTWGVHSDVVNGKIIWALTPGNALISAQDKYGTVCREMAALLYWSLRQVARWSGSNNMALTENDFSVGYTVGFGNDMNNKAGGVNHTWITLNMPVRGPDGMNFQEVDLDPTWYNAGFVSLYQRHTGLSADEQKSYYDNCVETENCLSATLSPPKKKKK